MGNTAQEKGSSHVPDHYLLPPSNRPSQSMEMAVIPIIDISGLGKSSHDRSLVVKEIENACQNIGCFQIANHGIDPKAMSKVIAAASDFFNLPMKEKREFMSNDVNKPVRYGTSIKDGVDGVQYWRVFLKHYAHPLEEWIASWPKNPPNYRSLNFHCIISTVH
ncbi:hypothetical protein Scep_026603 [Stephania cephalantha]|uniref:Non-haem dioxygenase N-terminal domain-containing protein n=1 Tax=Stephania cephalantha TaxID=152367 RepID=A0AAP0EKV6_9MAGN